MIRLEKREPHPYIKAIHWIERHLYFLLCISTILLTFLFSLNLAMQSTRLAGF